MQPVTRDAARAVNIVLEATALFPVVAIQWRAGDLLVIDNSHLLHSRGEAIRDDPDRVLERVLVGD
jgi:alpha-ketoglutarate-dependent taurine dioxygenase